MRALSPLSAFVARDLDLGQKLRSNRRNITQQQRTAAEEE
jgi:hypothetical protein